MADRTLTINHADGGSETYTIKRDKFAGVREMSRGHVYPSSQFQTSGNTSYWSATSTSGTDGTEWNLVSDLDNDGTNNFASLILASNYTASKVRVGKHRVEFNLTLNSGVIDNGASNLGDRPLVLVTRDYDNDPTTSDVANFYEVAEGFNSIDVEVFDDGVEIAGLNFAPSIFLSARPSSVFDVTITNLKITHEPDTVTVDRTAPDLVRTIIADGQTITIDTTREGVRTLTVDGTEITIDRSEESNLESFIEQFTGASVAYSLLDLASTSGNTTVVRVRRSSDNTEADFKAKEVSDGTLVAWVGAGNDGFVETWYDQSGNGNDAVQQVSGSQPKIVDAGAVVTAKPTIKLYGIYGQSNSGGYAPVSEAGSRFDSVDSLAYTAKIYNKDLSGTDRIARFNFNGNQNKTNEGSGNSVFGPESECIRLAASTDEHACIVKYSVANTSLATRWDSEGGDLYHTFIEDYKDCVTQLEALGFVVQHMGLLFAQGEWDSVFTVDGGAANYYEDKQQKLIDNTRSDLGLPNLPIALTTISAGATKTYPHLSAVNTAKANVASATSGVTLIDSSSYTFVPDDIHYDGASQIQHGAGFFAAATGTETTGDAGIAIKFDGAGDKLEISALTLGDFYAVALMNFDDPVNQERILGNKSSGSNGWGVGNIGIGFFRGSGGSSASPSLNTNIIPDIPAVYAINRVNDVTTIYTRGVETAPFTRSQVFAPDSISGSAGPLEGKLSSLVVYPSDQSDNREAIEALIRQ